MPKNDGVIQRYCVRIHSPPFSGLCFLKATYGKTSHRDRVDTVMYELSLVDALLGLATPRVYKIHLTKGHSI